MQPDIETPAFAIFDDLLSEDDWGELWTYFQVEELRPVSNTAGAWTLEDGNPLIGPDVHTPNRSGAALPEGLAGYPSQTPLDTLLGWLLEHSEKLQTWVGTDWERITGRAHVYAREQGLGWHCDDHNLYTGAFVYYVHPVWSVNWGGELLVGSLDREEPLSPKPMRFDAYEYDEALMDHGLGHYINPRPNRLVVLGGSPHRVAPVLPAAGDNVRASVAGFFLR